MVKTKNKGCVSMDNFFKGVSSIALGILFGFIATTVTIYMFYLFLKATIFVLEKL